MCAVRVPKCSIISLCNITNVANVFIKKRLWGTCEAQSLETRAIGHYVKIQYFLLRISQNLVLRLEIKTNL